jgi:diguanylate cyclase (GGDEF)-like protein
MALDVTTFSLAGGLATIFSGLFLLVYWGQDRTARPALVWAVGHCGLGVGIILVALHAVLPFSVANIAAPLLLDLSAPFAFAAARIFNRGSLNAYRIITFVAAWIALLAVTGALVREQIAAALGVGTSACFYAAAAFEFWRGRGEALRGRLPIIVVVSAYAAALFLLALQFASTINYHPIASIDWLGIVQLVGLGYALGVTSFLIMMLNGRNETHYKTAALTDSLTGLANRRAFMDRAQRMFDRAEQDANPIALIAFDLDRFKRINDTFGHATGDQVLRAFADVLLTTLRQADIGARLGGEEFVAIVPGVSDEVAMAIAKRICDAFEKTAQFIGGQKIEATVSAGVATIDGQPNTLAALLAGADAALYRAKAAGRNRVVFAGETPVRPSMTNVVRIA